MPTQVGADTRKRIFGIMAAILVTSLGLGPTLSPAVYGQADEKKEAPADEVKADKTEKKDAVVQTKAADDQVKVKPRENFFIYMYKASPEFFIIMGLVSIFLGYLIVNSFLAYQLPNYVPPELTKKLDGLLGEQRFKDAYEAVRTSPSPFGRAVAAGVERLSHGFDRAMDALVVVAEDSKMEAEHKISLISVIGQLGPLLGLLGTVLGMIDAFQRIAQGGQPRPAEIAEAIGLALVSTLEGICVALPAIFFFAWFRNKIARLTFEVESLGEAYLWRFSTALKK